MTSAAVWSAKPRDAVTSRAVLRSRVPASADVRTSEASSAGLRAADSSSWGSMPSASRVRLATPLSSRIIGFVAIPNQRTGAAATFAVAQRQRHREGLGHHLADDHREHRGDEHGEDRRPPTRRPTATGPRSSQGPAEQRADRRAGDEAEHEGGQRDAELAGRELGRQPAVRGEDRPGPLLPRVDGALHGGAVERHERELGRDEQRRAHGEDDAEEQEQPWGHRSGHRMVGAATGCRPAPGPHRSRRRDRAIHRGVDPHVAWGCKDRGMTPRVPA